MTKSGKHCGKRRNCLFWAISSFVTMFSKSRLLQRHFKIYFGMELKTLCQKKKLLIMNDFLFCHTDFKRHLLQMCQNASVSWKRFVKTHEVFVWIVIYTTLYSCSLISSPIRRNRGAYVVTLALAYAFLLTAWSNLCVQGLFSDTVYAVALKLHTLIQGH